MKLSTIAVALVSIYLLLAIGCSNNTIQNPVAPSQDQETQQDLTSQANEPTQGTHTQLWGYFDLYFNLENNEIEVAANRTQMFTANIVQFLNMNPLGIQISFNGTTPGSGYIDIDMNVTITHPLNNEKFDGYDVRGIFIGNATAAMAYSSDLKYAVSGTDQVLLNADGYTRWYNPTEFTSPGIFGYTQGNLAPPTYTGNATLNPYKYFAQDLGANQNIFQYLVTGGGTTGYFLHGSSNTRNYQIRFNIPNPGIKYGYAIVADWAGGLPADHPAHTTEAIGLSLEDNSFLYYVDPTINGGDLDFDITVFDWAAEITGGTMQDYTIILESTVLSAPYTFNTSEMSPTSTSGNTYTYHVERPANTVPGLTGNELWVIIEYAAADYSNPFGVPNAASSDNLAAFYRFDLDVVEIEECGPGPVITTVTLPNMLEDSEGTAVLAATGGEGELVWTKTGGPPLPTGLQLFSYGVIYGKPVIGSAGTYTGIEITVQDSCLLAEQSDTKLFNITVDPFEGGWAISEGGMQDDAYYGVASEADETSYVSGYYEQSPDSFVPVLKRYDLYGNLEWETSWGSEGSGIAIAVTLDGMGNLFVAGYYEGTSVDFDPGTGTDLHTSAAIDCFLSKFDTSGTWAWTETFGGAGDDMCQSVASDGSGNAYITGNFVQDIDPGDGSGPYNSNGGNDIFLCKFGSAGLPLWTNTWGGALGDAGEDDDRGNDVSVDGAGFVYVAGNFRGDNVNFNTSGGTDLRSSDGSTTDIFLSKFDSSGVYQDSHTWGGSDNDHGRGVAADTNGNVHVTGDFIGTGIDFDPTGGTDLHSSLGMEDVFLTRFDSSFNYVYTFTWGGELVDIGTDVTVDGDGNSLIVGKFASDDVDFRPDYLPLTASSRGEYDVFVSRFHFDGNFQWAQTMGGTEDDIGLRISANQTGTVHVAGYFMSMGAMFAPVQGMCLSAPLLLSSMGEHDAFLTKYLWHGCF